ncbi:amastigote surface protein 4 [Trypanosoma cruzi]|nr:amastigote surface protein 4 [Trypanosoma cruzi]
MTGSSGRRREGRESEPQRPNMSRRVFTSAVLLLLVVMMCYDTGAAANNNGAASCPVSSPGKHFAWRDVKEGEKVDSLHAPALVEVNGGVFAVAEAQCTKDEGCVFTGIASELLEFNGETLKEELHESKLKTQVLDECSASEERQCPSQTVKPDSSQRVMNLRVGRPTTLVKGSDIYMLVGNYSRTAATGTEESVGDEWGLLLARGNVSGEESGKRVNWNDTYRFLWTDLKKQQQSLTGLIGGGGSGLKMKDGPFLFPVEGTKKENGKTVSLIIYFSANDGWVLSKEVPADGCSDPSVVEWKGKLMMMTACDDGRRRVYESDDKGNSWTEALGTLSRVWGNKQGVRSGFTTATLGDDVGDDNNRNVMLVTLPVYSMKTEGVIANEKGELHLWLTDNTHIVDIGPVSGDDDAAASSLLYKSGNNNNEELIALYEKKKGDGEKPSPGMVSVRLTAQLQRVKDVLATWKKVDGRVSKLCPSEKNASPDTACSTAIPTDGLVGFLSGNFSGNTWRDEYLGVNAKVKCAAELATEATLHADGVNFTGRGAWAEWPVGEQGENQLYHFANYNFTLVATVSIHGEPKEGETPIPLMGAKMNDNENPVLLGLSYDSEKKWRVLCSGQKTEKLGSTWEPQTTYQVAIVLQNGTQGSAYVDGKRVGDESCEYENTRDKGISHFYIGGDGSNAEGQEGVSVTVTNVLLYNRPLTFEEIAGLAKNTITIPKPEGPTTLVVDARSPTVSALDVERTVLQPNSAGQPPLEEELLNGGNGADAGGVSSAASIATTPSSDFAQEAATGSGDTMLGTGSTQAPEVSVSSGEDEETAKRTDGQQGIHPHNGEVNATALNSSLGNLSRGNNTDGGTMRGSGLLPLLLLLGLWGFAAL